MSRIDHDGLTLEITDADDNRAVAYLYAHEGQLIINAQSGASVVIIRAGADAVSLLKRFAASVGRGVFEWLTTGGVPRSTSSPETLSATSWMAGLCPV